MKSHRFFIFDLLALCQTETVSTAKPRSQVEREAMLSRTLAIVFAVLFGVALISFCSYVLYVNIGQKHLKKRLAVVREQNNVARAEDEIAHEAHEQRLLEQQKQTNLVLQTTVAKQLNDDEADDEKPAKPPRKTKRSSHGRKKKVVAIQQRDEVSFESDDDESSTSSTTSSSSTSAEERKKKRHEKKILVTELPSVSSTRGDES